MHDPMTHIADFCGITLWHVDPEKDGSDDSCGWFMRARHGDDKVLKKIKQDFAFAWDHGVPFGWFNENGDPMYSTQAIVVGMFLLAANNTFGHWSGRSERFLRKHAFRILHFAENNCDSLFDAINQTYGRDGDKEHRIEHMASCVYSWILRADRAWYRHPRWHFWHWKVQINPLLSFKRWAFSRCEKCGGRFKWNESPCTYSWNGKGPRWFRSEPHIHHMDCGGSGVVQGAQVMVQGNENESNT